MKTVLLFVSVAVLLSGCAHQLELVSRDNSGTGTGVAQEAGKQVTFYLKGKTYHGTYVSDSGSVAFFNTNGSATAYSGNRTAVAYGNATTTAYIPGSGNGRAFARSDDGDGIRCEFQFKAGSGLGVCQDNSGILYDLIIH